MDKLRYNDSGTEFRSDCKGKQSEQHLQWGYKGSLNVGATTRGGDDIEKNLQKMIPDGWIGRFLLDA